MVNWRNSLRIKNKNTEYVPARDAGRVFGYTSDYVARLAREGKVNARRIGHQWFVDPESLALFVSDIQKQKTIRNNAIKEERRKEQKFTRPLTVSEKIAALGAVSGRVRALLMALGVVVAGGMVGAIIYAKPVDEVSQFSSDVASAAVSSARALASTANISVLNQSAQVSQVASGFWNSVWCGVETLFSFGSACQDTGNSAVLVRADTPHTVASPSPKKNQPPLARTTISTINTTSAPLSATKTVYVTEYRIPPSSLLTSAAYVTPRDLATGLLLLRTENSDSLAGLEARLLQSLRTTESAHVFRSNSGGGAGTFTTLSSDLLSGTRLSITGTATSTLSGDVAFDSSTLYIDSINHRVGIGTTAPAGTLHVAGQCVTGDTKLRRRRKKKNADGTDSDEYDYDEVRIDAVQAGDEIASLNETTGTIVWSRVKALMDMGIKPIYKLTTASGKTIRTTGEHPYLVKRNIATISHSRGFSRARVGIFIDSSNLYHAAKKAKWQISLSHLKQVFNQAFDVVCANCYVVVPREGDITRAGMLAYAKAASRFFTIKEKPLKYIFDQETERELKKGDIDLDLSMDVMRALPQLDAVVVMSGDSDYLALAAYTKERGIPTVFMSYKDAMAWELRLGDHLFLERIRQSIQRGETITNPHLSAGAVLTSSIIARAIKLSSGNVDNAVTAKTGVWTKVMNIKSGQQIAIASPDNTTAIWDTITSIDHLPSEQVYDIEVEGTHNFIGNDIIAHNTYITGGLGIGQTETTNGNITGTGRLSITSTTATSTFSTGGLTVGTSQFVVQQNSGNVGIGTTGPGATLDVTGTGRFSSTLTASNGLAVTTGGSTITAGNLAIGAGVQPNIGVYIAGTSISGVTGYGALFNPTITLTGAASEVATFRSVPVVATTGSNYALTNFYGFLANTPSKTGSGVITSAYGGYFANPSLGATNNYGVYVETPSGATNNYGLFVNGGTTVLNASAGNVGIGTTSPVSKLSVVGESAFAGGASVGIGYAGTAAPTGGMIIQGNVGIGTTGSGEPLTVYKNGVDEITADPRLVLRLSATDGSKGGFIGYSNSEQMMTLMTNGASSGINFWTHNGSAWGERMRISTTGNVGIGTTSPYALLSVQSGASTGNAFVVATSTGGQIGGYDNDGHRFSSGPAPAISSCGTGSPSVVGDDNGGTITTGTTATACTLTFSKAYRKTPYCTETDNSATIPGSISTLNTTTMTLSLGAGLTGGIIYYQCSYSQ